MLMMLFHADAKFGKSLGSNCYACSDSKAGRWAREFEEKSSGC